MRLVMGSLEEHKKFIVEQFVNKYDESFTMFELDETKQQLPNFPYALEALDFEQFKSGCRSTISGLLSEKTSLNTPMTTY